MVEENRRLARRWFEEVWNARRAESIAELVRHDAVGHVEGGPDMHGIAPWQDWQRTMLAAFPDLHVTIEQLVAEGDYVVVRWRFDATHAGRALGLEPTNQRVTVRGTTWLRFADRRIAEGWDTWNRDGLFAQLGLVPLGLASTRSTVAGSS